MGNAKIEGVESSQPQGNGDIEQTLIEKIMNTHFDDLPEEAIEIGKALVLTILGTAVAGAKSEGCEALVEQAREWGGRKEATIMVYGDQVPAHNAVFVNAFMARALDFCDGMIPGLHLGATCVTSALAVSELIGGCSGRDFLAHLVAGTETVARINACSTYKGNAFKPTGVAGILGVAALAGRMLQLNSKQMLHALALAFNRSGGSFQSNIDGALSVRAVMGFASQGGIVCAQLAKRGITGPENFLKGKFGYFYLFGEDKYDTDILFGDWLKRLEIKKIQFKRYPTCWNNTSSIDAMLKLVEEKGLVPDDVDRIDVTITPHEYRLVGHPFQAGDNLRVNAQFSARYSVAAALVRKALRLEHFDEPAIRDPRIMAVVDRIDVTADPELQEKGRNAAVVRVKTKDGKMHEEIILSPRGRPENPLTREDHIERFNQCFNYAGMPGEYAERILAMVLQLEELPDVRALIPLLVRRKSIGSVHPRMR
jgi:2-methylcitrate dehydratase PrpD